MVPIEPSPGWLLVKTYPIPESMSIGNGRRLMLPQSAAPGMIMQAHALVSEVIEIGPPVEQGENGTWRMRPSRYKPGQYVLHPPFAGVTLSESPHRDMLHVADKSGYRLIKEEDLQGTAEADICGVEQPKSEREWQAAA
jgi:hypothetical protein